MILSRVNTEADDITVLELRCLAALGRLKSLSIAAASLGMSQGEMLTCLLALQGKLGTMLFARHGRLIALTEAGAAYGHAMTAALAQLQAGAERVQAPSGRVAHFRLPSEAEGTHVAASRKRRHMTARRLAALSAAHGGT